MDFYALNKYVIDTATMLNDCSMMEMVASVAQPGQWYVSHWFGLPILHFMRCIDKHMKEREHSENVFYWVFAFACRPHSDTLEICQKPHHFDSYTVMQQCTGMLMVVDDVLSYPDGTRSEPGTIFTRIWTGLEGYLAFKNQNHHKHIGRKERMLFDFAMFRTQDERDDKKKEEKIQKKAKGPTSSSHVRLLLDGLTPEEKRVELIDGPGHGVQMKTLRESMFPISLLAAGLTYHVENCHAHKPKDRIYMLNCFADRVLADVAKVEPDLVPSPNFEKLNRQVRSSIAVKIWRQAAEQGNVEHMGLVKVLSEAEWLESLEMSFRSSKKLSNLDVDFLAQGLPQRLKTLSIDMFSCEYIGDLGLMHLALSLPASLTHLELNCARCTEISHHGFGPLGEHLPAGIEELVLDFGYCHRIDNQGFAKFCHGLGPHMTRLNLCFSDCGLLNDDSHIAMSKKLPAMRHLHTLHLKFLNCTKITDKGFMAMCNKLPHTLQFLQLDYEGCTRLAGDGLAALGRNLSHELHEFHLDLRRLDMTPAWADEVVDTDGDAITDASQIAGMKRSGNKKKVNNDPEFSGLMGDHEIAALIRGLPHFRLTKLYIDLSGCGAGFGDMAIATLGDNMPVHLANLFLNFANCQRITDHGFAALAEGLPRGLRIFSLDFSGCKQIGNPGVAALAAVLPRLLFLLSLNLHVDGTTVADEKKEICADFNKLKAWVPPRGLAAKPAEGAMLVGLSHVTH
eukprot:gnl/TRDRNA2_/TRDRNA2_135717_c2_seq1.p1 gnl/TRDRNA2_/TRDRNA2_135717_c2~~gnl/TRDRNA2_/TRDRNA2_135717_c2_seq1.p1  ORF type:complete len:735 (-),score=112.79 gnl/TRDRNA2_/TRDRNA2_135717_c2_seq1:21-2225(-)